MQIAQISDFHVLHSGRQLVGSVDTRAKLERAVRLLNSIKAKPDLVIGTGDFAENGRSEEYAQVRSILAGLNMPFLPVIGNHDDRLAFLNAFADLGIAFGPSGFAQFVHDLDDIRIVVLDTVCGCPADDPVFCTERLTWLRQALDSSPHSVLIAMHHPPFPIGIRFMNPHDPSWSSGLANVIHRSGKVKKIICGHVHRGVHRNWAGVSVSAVPSIGQQIALDLMPNAPLQFSRESAGFHIHQWDGEEFTTYAAATAGFGDNFVPNETE